MQIHQMTANYIPEQDRILVRLNTRKDEEMRLWLTRRLMAGLWPAMSRLIADQVMKTEGAGAAIDGSKDQVKKALADFHKEQSLSKSDFGTPYREGASILPLGEEPLLVTDIDLTPKSSGAVALAFRERAKEGETPRSLKVDMALKMAQGFMHLLESVIAKSQWRDPFEGPVPAARRQEDTMPDAKPPRYLN